MNDELQIRRAKYNHLVSTVSGSHTQNRLVKASEMLRVFGVDEDAGASWCGHDDSKQ